MESIILRPPTQLAEDWMILIFLFVAVVFARSKSQSPGKIKRLWNISINVRLMRQVMREENKGSRESFLFFVSFILLLSLAIYLAAKLYHWLPQPIDNAWAFPLIAITIGLSFALKSVAISTVQVLSGADFTLEEYRYNVFLIYRLTALALWPLVAFLAYCPLYQASIAFWTVLAVLGIAFIYRIGRGLLNAYQSGISVFYIFFYICTLEILPLFVGWRIINP